MNKRLALWWGLQSPPRVYALGERIHRLKGRIHRLEERYTFRDKNDPESKWRCCELWQRSLDYKWNAREFAQKHGCRVPRLYWSGRKTSRLPFDSLPDRYVIKPNFGFSRKGVYVMARGVDLLTRTAYAEAELREPVRQFTGGLFGQPILVEELVTDNRESGLPTEYKCHVFLEKIAAIQVLHRGVDQRDTKHRFYTEQWEIFDDPISTKFQTDNYSDPPGCLDEMLTMAKRLGRAYGTYVRVDFYASEQGCVFGEFASSHGRGFTRYA
ncbi:MAG: ATP-grasp fold amidoligase family protein, partial [Candidatus Binatia bacterium]